MLQVSDAILVAVSGGPDSVALLHNLLALKAEYRLTVTVGHLNHKLRGQAADEDAQFVATLAGDLGLPCRIDAADVRAYAHAQHLSLEDAGRGLRYRFLRETAQIVGASRIALGHTRNDQAETVLLRLLRGTGTTGLCGIRPVLTFPDGAILIRPLIECDRSEVLDFLHAQSLPYREDASNQDLRFDRNRLRAQFLPLLARDFNPQACKALAQHAALAQEDEAWMAQMAETDAARLLQRQGKGVVIAVAELTARPVALQRRLLRRALQMLKGDLRRIEYAHVEALRALCAGGMSGKQAHLPDGLQARREFAHLILSRQAGDPPSAFSYRLPIPGCVSVPEANCLVKAECLAQRDSDAPPASGHASMTALFDAATIGDELIVRSRRPGDRCRLGNGASRKLKEIFIARKVPRGLRDRIPLITRPVRPDSAAPDAVGSLSSSEVLWIPGCFLPPTAASARQWVRITIEPFK